MATREEEALQRVASDPRRQFGWGPSALASQEEKEAYQAYQMLPQVQAGTLPVSALPEAYGGRPTGTSRRAIRMQAEYDADQKRLEEQQRFMQQMDQAQRQEQMFQLDYASKQYDLRTKQNEELFNLRKDADLKQAEAEFTEFRNKLNPNDPASVGLLYSYISSDPRLANSKVAYTSSEFFAKAAEDSITSINAKQQEAKAAIINKAYAEGLTEREIEATKFVDPDTGIADYNYAEIEKLTAQRAGERKTKEPEQKEEYKPISVAEARDRRDVIQAEFDALSASVEKGELEDDDPDYVKTRARLRKAEAELKVAERAKPSEAPAQKRPTEGSGFQDSLEKLNMVNDKLGQDYLNGVKRLGIDNVSDDTIKQLLSVTGFNNKNELVSALKDQSALDWANANPDDPRSSRIKQRLGVD